MYIRTAFGERKGILIREVSFNSEVSMYNIIGGIKLSEVANDFNRYSMHCQLQTVNT